jgi:transposase
MTTVKVERLDHLGVIAGVIKDVGLIDMIDTRIAPDDQEEITTGEAVAGMILNGLGFSNRPLSLTPQFFEGKPLDLLFREGVETQINLDNAKALIQQGGGILLTRHYLAYIPEKNILALPVHYLLVLLKI